MAEHPTGITPRGRGIPVDVVCCFLFFCILYFSVRFVKHL